MSNINDIRKLPYTRGDAVFDISQRRLYIMGNPLEIKPFYDLSEWYGENAKMISVPTIAHICYNYSEYNKSMYGLLDVVSLDGSLDIDQLIVTNKPGELKGEHPPIKYSQMPVDAINRVAGKYVTYSLKDDLVSIYQCDSSLAMGVRGLIEDVLPHVNLNSSIINPFKGYLIYDCDGWIQIPTLSDIQVILINKLLEAGKPLYPSYRIEDVDNGQVFIEDSLLGVIARCDFDLDDYSRDDVESGVVYAQYMVTEIFPTTPDTTGWALPSANEETEAIDLRTRNCSDEYEVYVYPQPNNKPRVDVISPNGYKIFTDDRMSLGKYPTSDEANLVASKYIAGLNGDLASHTPIVEATELTIDAGVVTYRNELVEHKADIDITATYPSTLPINPLR